MPVDPSGVLLIGASLLVQRSPPADPGFHFKRPPLLSRGLA